MKLPLRPWNEWREEIHHYARRHYNDGEPNPITYNEWGTQAERVAYHAQYGPRGLHDPTLTKTQRDARILKGGFFGLTSGP